MTDLANPIVLDMAFERLRFETGFDVRAVIAERDRYKEALAYALVYGTDEHKHFDRVVAIRDAA